MIIDEIVVGGYERVIRARDEQTGYHSIIALHTLVDGRAFGGTRMMRYATEQDALGDVLDLAFTMTRKAGTSKLPAGGGKAVILEQPGSSRASILEMHAAAINELAGIYVTAPDVGMSHADVAALLQHTPYVTSCRGTPTEAAEHTARGVLRAIEAAVLHRLGRDTLEGMSIAIQGCGQVGSALAYTLADRGAKLFVCDVDGQRVDTVVRATGATPLPCDELLRAHADVFAPCALGYILSETTIPELNVSIVAGAANNQLRTPADEERMCRRRITYVPDYIASAGGLISGVGEYIGWSLQDRLHRIDNLFAITSTALADGHPMP